jgi:hypothetical protein
LRSKVPGQREYFLVGGRGIWFVILAACFGPIVAPLVVGVPIAVLLFAKGPAQMLNGGFAVTATIAGLFAGFGFVGGGLPLVVGAALFIRTLRLGGQVRFWQIGAWAALSGALVFPLAIWGGNVLECTSPPTNLDHCPIRNPAIWYSDAFSYYGGMLLSPFAWASARVLWGLGKHFGLVDYVVST